MTEKVVSLSGGLLLGMVFALFLGIGATQSIPASSHFEMPSFMPMTITQNSHAPSTPTNDTTPTVHVATPSNPDRGRITRIATLEATTDPVFEPVTTTEIAFAEPKNFDGVSTPKIDNSLQRTNLQRSYIESNPQDNTFVAIGTIVARQNNTTSIIENTSGNSPSPYNPAGISGKPQTHGSPSVAHNDPGEGEGSEGPDFAGASKPGPGNPDPNLSDGNTRDYTESGSPSDNYFHNNSGGGTENDPGSSDTPRPNIQNHHRPETD